MPVSPEIKLGTFTLNSTNKISVASLKVDVAKRLSEKDLVKVPGSVIPITKRSSIRIPVMLRVIGTSYENLQTNLDALYAELETDVLTKFTIDDGRYLMAAFGSPDVGWDHFQKLAVVRFDVRAPYPYWISETASNDSEVGPTTGVGYVVAAAGNTQARTKITITNGSGGDITDDIKIENQTTGEQFEFEGVLADTKALVIDQFYSDHYAFTVQNDGVDARSKHFGDKIHLAPGNNTIVLTSAAAAGITVRFDWRDTYL